MRIAAREHDVRRIEQALTTETALLEPGSPEHHEMRRHQSDIRHAITVADLPDDAPGDALEHCLECDRIKPAGSPRPGEIYTVGKDR